MIGPPEERWDINKARPEKLSMLVFYRGLHCPFCRNYLQEIERRFDDFSGLGIEIAAISMDDRGRAQQARAEWGLRKLPVGYDLSEEVARSWGLFISEGIKESEPRRFSEPGLFLVQPDRRVFYVAVNSMPFGRPLPAELLSSLKLVLEEGMPPRGTVMS